jgi:hypothetical protein
MRTLPANYRILIPKERWTPVRTILFRKDLLAKLEERHSALLYLILYDRARHDEEHTVSATVAELVQWSGLNQRTVQKCVKELETQDLIRLHKKGKLRSRSRKPVWWVKHADFSLAGGKSWFPVPRFTFRSYCKRYPNAVLLVLVHMYQHMGWNAYAWPGTETICDRLGWSATRVRDALRVMSDEESWRGISRRLLMPLKVYYIERNGRRYRRLSVLSVSYKRRAARRGSSAVWVSDEFRKYFKLPKPKSNFDGLRNRFL